MKKVLRAGLVSVMESKARLMLSRPPSCLMIIPNSISNCDSRTDSELDSEVWEPELDSDCVPGPVRSDGDGGVSGPRNWSRASRAASGLLLWEYLLNNSSNKSISQELTSRDYPSRKAG